MLTMMLGAIGCKSTLHQQVNTPTAHFAAICCRSAGSPSRSFNEFVGAVLLTLSFFGLKLIIFSTGHSTKRAHGTAPTQRCPLQSPRVLAHKCKLLLRSAGETAQTRSHERFPNLSRLVPHSKGSIKTNPFNTKKQPGLIYLTFLMRSCIETSPFPLLA